MAQTEILSLRCWTAESPHYQCLLAQKLKDLVLLKHTRVPFPAEKRIRTSFRVTLRTHVSCKRMSFHVSGISLQLLLVEGVANVWNFFKLLKLKSKKYFFNHVLATT